MKKKSDKELGVVLPESMVDAIGNRQLTDGQVGQLIRSVLWNSMEYGKGDIVVSTLASTLVGTYRGANSARIKKIKASRESKKEYERKRREKANIVEDAILKSVKENMEFHGIVGKVRLGNSNTPIIPLAGDEKSSSAKTDVHAHTGKATTRPTTGGPSTGGRRTGTTKQQQKGALDADNGTARTKAGSARPTARKLARSGDILERQEPTSKKTGGGRCRWMDAEGFCTSEKMQGGGFKCIGCENREPIGADGSPGTARPTVQKARGLWDGAAVVVNAAEAMMARHPNAKSGKRAVVRAIAATVEEEPGEGPETVDAIRSAHEAWCATDGWAEEKGQFVQALAAWIRNGGWRKLPPQKKKPAPSKGDEISFDASL